jgi:DNA-binding transcriptional ArsR family regulator
MASETFHLRATREAIEAAIDEALTYVGWVPRDQIAGHVLQVMERLDRLVVSQVDTNDKPALHRGASKAQRMTVDQLATTISDKRLRALSLVAREKDGITCDALEAKHGLSHSSASSQLNWLEENGLVYRAGESRRKTRSGGLASPYCMSRAGLGLLAVRAKGGF